MPGGDVVLFGGVGGDVVEFEVAVVFAGGVAELPGTFADVGFAAVGAGFSEQRLRAHMNRLA